MEKKMVPIASYGWNAEKQYVELQLLINEEIYVMPVYEKDIKGFVEHEWEVTCRLADYYSSTEDELIADGGLTYREIDNLEQLRDLSNNTDVIAFM